MIEEREPRTCVHCFKPTTTRMGLLRMTPDGLGKPVVLYVCKGCSVGFATSLNDTRFGERGAGDRVGGGDRPLQKDEDT